MGAATHHIVGASMIETPEPAAQELDLPVLANDPVNDEYMLLVLKAPRDLLERCRSGQFFHLLCPAIGGEKPYLRRPMSIYGFYPERGELHFLYKVTGSGTRALFHLGAGDSLNVLGPLGEGFRIEPDWQRLMLVARGVGLATLAPLALEAICLRAMALKPEDRYASAGELAEDLERWLAGEAISTTAERRGPHPQSLRSRLLRGAAAA